MDISHFFIGFILLMIMLAVLNAAFPVGLWIGAFLSGVNISPVDLISMRFRGIEQSRIVRPLIMIKKANLPELITADDLQTFYLSGGNIVPVISALIAARGAGISLSFQQACAIDRAGRDVLGAVKMSVNPKVIETPAIGAVAQDGIEIIAVCRVTIKADINRLVGGSGEETILAKVQEGICTAIGSAKNYQDVLESPEIISKTVQNRGFGDDSAFNVVSIDIADIDVGRNIGANLQINQAEADKEIAQAKAETRKAEAIAKEQEMKAYIQNMKAKVIEAQAEVPKAMGEALQTGRISVMNYYNLKNLMADTEMRQSMAGGSSESKGF